MGVSTQYITLVCQVHLTEEGQHRFNVYLLQQILCFGYQGLNYVLSFPDRHGVFWVRQEGIWFLSIS